MPHVLYLGTESAPGVHERGDHRQARRDGQGGCGGRPPRRAIRSASELAEARLARLRSTIKRLLARHNYLPDQAPEAINLVLQQMVNTTGFSTHLRLPTRDDAQ